MSGRVAKARKHGSAFTRNIAPLAGAGGFMKARNDANEKLNALSITRSIDKPV